MFEVRGKARGTRFVAQYKLVVEECAEDLSCLGGGVEEFGFEEGELS